MISPITIEQIIDDLIEREGGYSDRSADKGGPTNWGITIRTLRNLRNNPNLTAQDVKRLTKDEARQIYQHEYIEAPKFNLVANDHLRIQLIDFGVNSGPDDAVKAMQRVIGVKEDGNIGPVTLAALKKFGYIRASNCVMRERVLHLGRQVRDDKRIPKGTNAENINGWLIRATDFMIP